jgi:hypothetical protein
MQSIALALAALLLVGCYVWLVRTRAHRHSTPAAA